MLLSAHFAERMLLAKFLNGRSIVEKLRQPIGPGDASGRIGVVLHQVQRSVGKMRIEPAGDLQSLVPWIDCGQHFSFKEARSIRQ